ncbi:hypothetical protein AVEN_235783-1 [Araneus ventricosus]|uniref:Uncharacterized protein n=1 Tax=Araneus ventricosus TaxID=182803 RepID=A0A4Y2HM02_ARAVE|nr:hypothetical protein AVEN_235783-1 [Araneus ventricosus]
MVSRDEFVSNVVFEDQSYSQRILEISLPHRFLPQNDRKCMGRGYQQDPHFAWKKLWSVSAVECDIEESETVPRGALVGECCRM